MLFKINFKIFDFFGFINSINELVNNHEMKNIRFSPKQHEDLFNDFQLTHIGDLNNIKGFVGAWQRVQDRVRKVAFDSFVIDESKKITMSIDLDDKSIFLNKAKGISPVEVEAVFRDNMVFIEEPSLEKNKKIGILNQGRNNTYIKNKFTRVDIGIKDEGENTLAVENEFGNDLKIEKLEIIKGDKFEQHGEKNDVKINNKSKKEKWYQKPWGLIFIGVVIIVIGTIILDLSEIVNLNGFFAKIFNLK